MKTALIFRSKERKEFSIETLFECLKSYINNTCEIHDYFLPHGRYNNIKALLSNVKYAKEIKADVYHITGEVNFIAVAFPKNQSIITVHDYVDIENMRGIKKMIRWLFWCYIPYRRCKYLACISHKTARETVEKFPFTKEKVVYIPNPIDDSYTFTPKQFNADFPRILVVGTRENKNLERIVEAVNGLKCSLFIIGVLSDRQRVLLEKYKINYENVFHISDEEMRAAYIQSDLVCFPSTYEGFGRPIIEANAIGRVVVTSNIEPMIEVSNGTGILVNPYSVESIREGIVKATTDEKTREMLINRGLDNAKQYKASLVADSYCKLYKQCYAK